MSVILEADTLLTADIGSVNTRASLFDVVDGKYRLVATGRASSTAGHPLFDVGEGLRIAFDQVQAVTGRMIVDETESLIMPSTSQGSGVDLFSASASAGPVVKAVLVGLMPGVSMESAKRLANSTYMKIVEQIDLMDFRREEEQIDAILAAEPDLILVVGGTDNGASESILHLIRTTGLAVSLIPEGYRPHVVYAGNQRLGASVMDSFDERTPVALVPNVRPDLIREDLSPARLRLADVISEVQSMQITGFDELRQWSGGNLMLSADAVGRVIRYLSQVYDPEKGVLGVDLGANHTTVAAAFDGDLRLLVESDLGLGSALPGILQHSSLDLIRRWLPIEVSPTALRDHIFNKKFHPGTVPATLDELHIEYALAREMIRISVGLARETWPESKDLRRSPLLPAFEPIVGSGAALARAPRPGYAALTMLDSLQPTGITTLVLDPYNLLPAMGAAISALPMVTVQVLESGSFVSLGTVITPVGQTRIGRPVLHVQVEPELGGDRMEGQIRHGQLAVLPLRQGEHARLTLRPERGVDIGFGGPGKAGTLRVAGGAVGLIIDARGRPIELPTDPARRRELNQKWLWDIGAME